MSADKPNVGLIHSHCSIERHKIFQELNPNLVLKPENCVKLEFPIEPDKLETRFENMWVVVEQADNEKKEARGWLLSMPLFAPYNVGDIFEFEYKEICEFAEKIAE